MSIKAALRLAHRALQGDRLQLAPLMASMRSGPEWAELILWRSGCEQIELVFLGAGAIVPRHRHLRADTVDVAIGGAAAFNVGGLALGWGDRDLRGMLAHLVPIQRGVWHGGQAGPQGGAFLSFQHWDGVPTHIADDWEAQ